MIQIRFHYFIVIFINVGKRKYFNQFYFGRNGKEVKIVKKMKTGIS